MTVISRLAKKKKKRQVYIFFCCQRERKKRQKEKYDVTEDIERVEVDGIPFFCVLTGGSHVYTWEAVHEHMLW